MSEDWLTRDLAIALVEAYGAAWAAQDAAAILALFTEDAVYSERPFASDKAVFTGMNELRAYWQRQIRGKQKNIRFRQCSDDLLLDVGLSRCLAKWEAFFDTRGKDGGYRPVHIIQVAILHLRPPAAEGEASLPMIARLEEYWHSEAMDSTEKGVEWEWPSRGYGNDNTCWDFLKGQCPRGDSCPYLHESPAPQAVPPSLAGSSPGGYAEAACTWEPSQSATLPLEGEPPAKRARTTSASVVVD